VAPRGAILTAGRARASGDPALRQLAPEAVDRARIAENAVGRWRVSVAALYAALEARGHVEGDVPEAGAPPAPASEPI